MKFLNCKIDTSRKVFVPRPETEFWVGKAIAQIKKTNRQFVALDVFSGTGCIGIAVLRACPELCRRMDFVDIDPRAIEQVKINLKLNMVPKNKYRVYRSNLFEKIRDKYDFIFANPPYIAEDRIGEVQPEVLLNEPHTALLAGKGGMACIKKFLNQLGGHLNREGTAFLEFDPLQRSEIENILAKKCFKFRFRKDQFGKLRWLNIMK